MTARDGLRLVSTRWPGQLAKFRTWMLLAWGTPFALLGLRRDRSDWGFFLLASHVLTGYTDRRGYVFSGGLHLYAQNQEIQIGPPAVWLVTAFRWLPPSTLVLVMVLLMSTLGVVCFRCLESLWTLPRSTPGRSLLVGLLVVALWSYYLAGLWRHVDDVLALVGIAAGLLLIARRHPLLAGLVLGTGLAAKPWAIVAVPLLLGLPRADRARAALVTICVAGAWWGPFVLADSGTIGALGGQSRDYLAGSVPAVLGLTGVIARWVRPAQFFFGAAFASWVALRRDWRLAPLAGFVVKVLLDPFAWSYYGIAPLIAATAADLTSRRRVPLWTVLTAAAFYGVPIVTGYATTTAGVAKLCWLGMAGAGILVSRRRPALMEPAQPTRSASLKTGSIELVTQAA